MGKAKDLTAEAVGAFTLPGKRDPNDPDYFPYKKDDATKTKWTTTLNDPQYSADKFAYAPFSDADGGTSRANLSITAFAKDGGVVDFGNADNAERELRLKDLYEAYESFYRVIQPFENERTEPTEGASCSKCCSGSDACDTEAVLRA